MIRNFSHFEVKIASKKFEMPDGNTTAKTAIITFFNEANEILSTSELGYVSANEIFRLIEIGKKVHFQECYIEDFSLTEYRKNHSLQKNEIIRLFGFSATRSIFHSDKEIDFSYSKFTKGDVDFTNSIFLKGSLLFENCSFGNIKVSFENVLFRDGNVNFSKSIFGKGDITFKNSEFFDGIKNFQNSNFGPGNLNFERVKFGDGNLLFNGSEFGEGTLDFTRSTFGEGEISFSDSTFAKGDLLFVSLDYRVVRFSFKSARFNEGKVDFRYANFGKGDLIFDRAIFGKGIADFSATEFKEGKISFNRTEFELDELIFESSEIKKGRILFKNNIYSFGSINFKMIECQEAAIVFDNVNFGEISGSFYKAKIGSLIFDSCHLNGYFNLEFLKCSSLKMPNTVVRDILDIKSHDFKIDIMELDLSGLLLLGQIHLDWKSNKVRNLILNQKTSLRNKSEQFRILKENYHSLGQYNDEDQAYVAFKRSQTKADLEESKETGNRANILKSYILYGFKWLVFDKIGQYATNPARVLLSMVFTYLFFVLVFFLLPFFVDADILPSVDHPEKISILGKAFYHGIITFLTIGYGDYYPSGVFRWISGFEGFTGLFLISYFTVAFVRKVLR